MKSRYIHMLIAVVAFGIGCTCLYGLKRAGSPRLSVQDVVKLGEVERGKTASATIRLKNSGTSSLNIVKYGTQCGCTILKMPKQWLAPGEEETITVSLDTSGYWREVEKNAYIYSNDPKQPVKIIRIEAYVNVGIRLVGGDLDLGAAPGGAVLHGSIEVVKDSTAPKDSSRTVGGTAEIVTTVDEWRREKDADAQDVRISVDTSVMQSGSYAKPLEIFVGKKSVGKIQLNYTVLPRVWCTSDGIVLSIRDRDGASAKDVTLAWSGMVPEFKQVQSLYGHCSGEIVSRGEHGCVLRITRDPYFRNRESAFDVLTVSYYVALIDSVERMTIPVNLAE